MHPILFSKMKKKKAYFSTYPRNRKIVRFQYDDVQRRMGLSNRRGATRHKVVHSRALNTRLRSVAGRPFNQAPQASFHVEPVNIGPAYLSGRRR